MTSIVQIPKKATKVAADPSFFDNTPTEPAIQFPEYWERFQQTFLVDADWGRFSIKERSWFAAKGRNKDKTKEWDRPLSSAYQSLSRHLQPRPGQALQWMGAWGGKYTDKYCLDPDNHEAKDQGYQHDGRWLQVGELSVKYLALLKLTYDAVKTINLPTVIHTSSRSLGLNVWQLIPARKPAADVCRGVKGWIDRTGINDYLSGAYPRKDGRPVKMEVFPAFNERGEPSSVHRLPFGFGSFSLTSKGILRHWTDNLDHFTNPGPLPEFSEVVNMLIVLWQEQLTGWTRSGVSGYHKLRERQPKVIEEIQEWLKSDCPIPRCEAPVPAASAPAVLQESRRISEPKCQTAERPVWLSLPRHERVYFLATQGLQPKSLKQALGAVKELIGPTIRQAALNRRVRRRV